jgi:hypothetical protein
MREERVRFFLFLLFQQAKKYAYPITRGFLNERPESSVSCFYNCARDPPPVT